MAKKPTKKTQTPPKADAPEEPTPEVVPEETDAETGFLPEEDAVALEESVEEVVDTVEKAVEKPQGISLSAKALVASGLILLGGIGALYLGPKIAPSLPAGMAPVANFLAPGQSDATEKVAELNAALSARIETLENAPVPDVTGQIAAAQNELSAEITRLSDQVSASDSGDIEARLGQAEAKLTGVTAWIEKTNERLTASESGENAADASASNAIIESLRAELAAIAAKQGAMGQEIDQVKATTDRRVDEAQTKVEEVLQTTEKTLTQAAKDKAFSDIATALENGTSFADALYVLADGGMDVPAGLANAAEIGVVTLAAIKDAFSPAAHAALKADIKGASDAGVGSKLAGFFKSQVTVRSLNAKDGDDADAILSRMQAALDNDNLGAAINEAPSLSDGARAAMADWLQMAQARNDIITAINALSNN